MPSSAPLRGFASLILLSILVLGVCAEPAAAQTNPSARAMPVAEDFSALPAASTTYPSGFIGWRAGNHTIVASFAPILHTITASAGANGAIAPAGAVSVVDGDDQSFTITPDAHYQIADVEVDGVSVGAVSSYTFSDVTADHTITATFAQITHIITATAGDHGVISPSGAKSIVDGDDYSFAITPDARYQIADVLVDGVSVGTVTNYTFTNITADHTIAASFAPILHTITASAGANGAIAPSGAVGVTEGGSQSFTITPDSHYQVADVEVDGVSVGAVTSYIFSDVTEDHTIAASFSAIMHTITANAGANGSISPSGAVTVADGANQSFTITPDAHYAVQDVLVDGVSVGAVSSYSFTNVTADHTIAATFSQIAHTITASAGANGSISPSGAVGVSEGASQTYTITPDAQYQIADVLVDGSSVGAVTDYTFSYVVVGHTIYATFDTPTPTQLCATAEEGDGIVTLIAPPGEVITRIDFASYGTPGGSCGAFTKGGCDAAASQSIVESLCLGRSQCSIPARNDVFGDPCGGTFKRLYVEAHSTRITN